MSLNSVPPIAPSNSSLIPRREFQRELRHPSTFSILAFSGSSQIRLYSFPPQVTAGVRALLDRTREVVGHKEDVLHNFVELSVEGKPWASPKSLPTEKLVLDLIAVLCKHGYEFLSTLDYGREQDDRVIMAFMRPGSTPYTQSPPDFSPAGSKPFSPVTQSSQQALPLQQLGSSQFKQQVFGESSASLPPACSLVQVPFALSFPNATTLRVMCPPLSSTPAILQTVRSSWPRGVVSERKIAQDSWEFKLKGYRWFQEDTFAIDSLNYILSLLGSFDSHGFRLMTSLAVSNHARSKDLWIFTGASDPAQLETPPSSDGSLAATSQPDLRPSYRQRRRSNSVPDDSSRSPPPRLQSPVSGHRRTASQGGRETNAPKGAPMVLRKAAPRAQVPVSVISTGADKEATAAPILDRSQSEDGVRAQLPSTTGSQLDMTGVGARGFDLHIDAAESPVLSSPVAALEPTQLSPSPEVFYQTPPQAHNPYFPRLSQIPPPPPLPARPATPPQSSSAFHASPPRTAHDPPRPFIIGTPAGVASFGQVPPPPPLPARPAQQQALLQVVNADAETNLQPPRLTTHSSDASGGLTPPLLGPNAFRDTRDTEVFRDSAFSTSDVNASEIPITWSESSKEPAMPRQARPRSPTIPGGWLSPEDETPADDDDEEPHGSLEFYPRARDITPDRQDVNVGVHEIVHGAGRKSAAVELDQVPPAAPPPPVPVPISVPAPALSARGDEKPATGAAAPADKGEGWVLVDVTQSVGAVSTLPSSAQGSPSRFSTRPRGDSRAHPYDSRKPSISGNSPGAGEMSGPSLAAAAQAIVEGRPVAVEAGESSGSNSTEDSAAAAAAEPAGKKVVIADQVAPSEERGGLPASPIKRIFSKGKKGQDGGVRGKSKSFEQEEREAESEASDTEASPNGKRRIGLRERWRRRGVQEVTRADNRMSVD